ncbi:hypothetical protein [Flavobacterium sp. 270]|uniref:hypothetical protein n=1 Tax=Flavobacterium sp. 270 TaxID=2512114 RepID=UPI001066DE50|nr:hypothetical protein [Flavobacterium sp. 270]
MVLFQNLTLIDNFKTLDFNLKEKTNFEFVKLFARKFDIGINDEILDKIDVFHSQINKKNESRF